MPKLSVNLVAYNGEKYISPCLSSVLAQNFRDFSVLIIDNGSKDGTRNELEKLVKVFKGERIEVNIIFLNENVGFAEGHNIGMVESQKSKACHGLAERVKSQKYVCCLNQDIILMPDYLAEIVEFMDAHQECGSASGKLMRITDNEIYTNQRECEYKSTRILDYKMLENKYKIIDSAGLKIFKSRRFIEIGQGEEDNGQYDEIKEVFGVSGAVPVYRYVALEDIKISNFKFQISKLWEEEAEEQYEYFDKDFGNYKEDVDLAYRLRWRGWKNYVIPKVVAYHKRGAKQLSEKTGDFTAAFNRKNKSKYMNYCSQRNQIWTLVKNMDTLNFAVIWYEAKKFGYELLFEWSTFKAWFDIFKKIGAMLEKRKWIMGNKKITRKEMEKWME